MSEPGSDRDDFERRHLQAVSKLKSENADLKLQLAETEADRDRAWRRVKLLESRLDGIRHIVGG